MKTLLIWGATDQGTVTLDCALAMNVYKKIDFLDFKEKGHRDIKGYKIYQESEENISDLLKAYDEVIVAVGDNHLREAKVSILKTLNIPLATIIHPSAIISPFAKVSEGCTILANAVVHTNAFVGVGCIVNTGAIVEHDCYIEDYVNISPCSCMAGHTRIGTKTFMGIGSVVIDDIKVGKETIIGAGAVVIQDIPDRVLVVGVPARVIKQL